MAEICGGQAMESTAMAGNPFARGVLAAWLPICVQEESKTCSNFLTSNAAFAALLSGFCHLLYICVAAWIWSQSVKIFKRVQRNYSGGQQRLCEAVNTDRVWKDQIERLEADKAPINSEGNGESMDSSPSEGETNPLIPVSFRVCDSKVKQMILKQTIAESMFDAIDVKVHPIVQSKVVLNQQSMRMLHNLAVEGSKKDEKFTAQLSRWRIFIHTAGEVKMLKLDDAHEVPTILHAAYAAGKLTIQGFNLQGSEIKAATFDKFITLKDLTKEEVGRLQIWTSIVRLPSNNLGEVFVYATKPICIDDHNLTVCSYVINVQDDNLRIVLRVGIPSAIGLIYIIMMYMKLFCLDGWHYIAPTFVWILPPMVVALTQILPQSTEDALEVCIERLGLTMVALYFGIQRLSYKQNPKLVSSEIACLPKAYSLERSDCKKEENMDRREKKHAKAYSLERSDCKKEENMDRREKKHAKAKGVERKMEEKIMEEPQCFAYEEYLDKHGIMRVRKRQDTKSTKVHLPFKFIYGLKSKMWNERDYFKFYFDSDLIQVLRKFMPEKFNLMGSKKVSIYAFEFFHIQNELRKALDSFVEEISSAPSGADTDQLRAHIKYFWQFLDTTCQEVSDRYKAMKEEGCVSWDMLWALFPTNTRVVYKCALTGEELCAIAQSIQYSFRERDGVPKLWITLETWDYNCQTWSSHSNVRQAIPKYSESCSFPRLGICPLQFKTNVDEAQKKFLAKGAWFGELSMQARNRFMHYKGLMYSQEKQAIWKDAVNGRVMIDLASFAKMNPNHHLGNATPPSDVLRTDHVELIDISTREDRMFAPSIVHGFSFQNKRWGAFNIDGFEEIDFNEAAYDALVMDSRKKDTIYSLVHQYKRSKDMEKYEDEQVDPVVGKGEGCIFLCYGPPGTGKTFTAETISEKLHAPLWSLSVSELGITPEVLEKKLVKILDVAAAWGAILLLDEADVYLEKRDTGTMDLTRNAMTGIFLRNLEYYKGVLFLTTNRVVAFDDAFCSRISMFLYYDKHLEHDRRVIWKNLLEPLNVADLADFLDTDYASFDLNAREIRNVVQVARTLAKTKGEQVNGVYLRHSLETLASSLLELKRITGAPQTSSFKGIPTSC